MCGLAFLILRQRTRRKVTVPTNLATIFYNRIEQMGDFPALKFKVNKGAYQDMSWRELGRYVKEIGCGLAELGVDQDGKVAIFSQTSHLWVIADLATISNGAVSVPIYPTDRKSVV